MIWAFASRASIVILVLLSHDCLCYNVQQAIDTALEEPSPTTETADDKPPPPTLETMHNTEIRTEESTQKNNRCASFLCWYGNRSEVYNTKWWTPYL